METVGKTAHLAEAPRRVIRFLKDWTLPLAMITGVVAYLIYSRIPGHAAYTPAVNRLIALLQPALIFSMLFITFCRVGIREMSMRRWHLPLILFQTLSFTAVSLLAAQVPDGDAKILLESAMLCLICPTATAAAVITGKLGGNAASLTTYTILSNLSAAVMAPLLLPVAHPHEGLTFLPSLFAILVKVFPLLICPLLAAWIVRRFLPSLHARILRLKDLAFYLWAVALALAIAVTVKSIVHSRAGVLCQLGIAAVSLACCLLQFALGKRIGSRYRERISGGQALGQKNTVFAIWMGYTFLTPVTAVAGGFYCVWHNLINSWQLYRMRKRLPQPASQDSAPVFAEPLRR